MKLEQKVIVANMERYVASGEKHGFMNDKLLKLLGQEFIKAPASTMTSLHNAFEGGLVAHILEVMTKAYKLNGIFSDEKQALTTTKSIMKVAGLCQIGKAKLYIPNPSDWHREKLGKMYEFNEDITSMRVGERSLYYALICGIELSEEECGAILHHESKDDDLMVEHHNSQLGNIVRYANKLAIIEEKV